MQPAAYANFNLPKLDHDVALCDLYRDGNDSAGVHADAEPGACYRLAQPWRGALLSARANEWEAGICRKIAHGSLLVIARKAQMNF
jgi:hypothetical protein